MWWKFPHCKYLKTTRGQWLLVERKTYTLLSSCCEEGLHVHSHKGVTISTAQWESWKSEKSCTLTSVIQLVSWRAGIWTRFSLIARDWLFPHHHESLWLQNRQTHRHSPAASYTECATVLENFSPSELCINHPLQSLCPWYREKRGRGREGEGELNVYKLILFKSTREHSLSTLTHLLLHMDTPMWPEVS